MTLERGPGGRGWCVRHCGLLPTSPLRLLVSGGCVRDALRTRGGDDDDDDDDNSLVNASSPVQLRVGSPGSRHDPCARRREPTTGHGVGASRRSSPDRLTSCVDASASSPYVLVLRRSTRMYSVPCGLRTLSLAADRKVNFRASRGIADLKWLHGVEGAARRRRFCWQSLLLVGCRY